MRRLVLIAVAVLLIAGLLEPAPVLRTVGSALVSADGLQHADVIAIAVDAFDDGALEAGDLVASGIAERVAVFRLEETGVQQELRRRGLKPMTETDHAIATLRTVGVTAIDEIPKPVSGTTDSIPALVEWARGQGVHAIVLITSADHSRRVTHVVARTAPSSIRIIVRPTRYSAFAPDDWWRSRDGLRRFGEELPKLLLDATLHPVSYVF